MLRGERATPRGVTPINPDYVNAFRV